jgi:DNA-binding transcriptional MerR regulator
MSAVLYKYRDKDFDLAALCVAARDLLSHAHPNIEDERVSLYPDKRTLRYYNSLGLLNPPARLEGRKAIYGFPHLLQVVCIKMLQAKGLSLTKIQQSLPKLTLAQLEDALLEELAQLMPKHGAQNDRPRMVTVELKPGLTLTVDPRHFPDPESIIHALSEALMKKGAGQ